MTTVCNRCGGGERRLLLNVYHYGSFRRLCSTCILRLHPQSFCPTCFTVYHHHSPPPNANVVTCTTCYSLSHSSCVGSTPRHPYICPMCLSSPKNAPIFVLNNVQDLISKGSKRGAGDFLTCPNAENRMVIDINNENGVSVDVNAGRALVAAATISSLSMRKAELAAKFLAKIKAKEAADAMKRAQHALDYMTTLVSNEKSNEGSRIEVPPMTSFGGNVGGVVERRDVGNGGGGSFERDRVLDHFEGLKMNSNEVYLKENEILDVGSLGDGNNLKKSKMSSSGMLARNITGVEFRERGGVRGCLAHNSAFVGSSSSNYITSLVSRLDVGNLGEGNLEKSKKSSNKALGKEVTGVEFRERGGLRGCFPQNDIFMGPSSSNSAIMNVHGEKGMNVGFKLNVENSHECNLKKLKRSSNGVIKGDN